MPIVDKTFWFRQTPYGQFELACCTLDWGSLPVELRYFIRRQAYRAMTPGERQIVRKMLEDVDTEDDEE